MMILVIALLMLPRSMMANVNYVDDGDGGGDERTVEAAFVDDGES